uniref:hypothetical protein Ycf21 n=1 Tax=Aphanocladia delicatula TaxID=3041656 RepID=UPI0025520668|nr:hypothetical protein Ycf21 [Aphanocladia delicatula]WGH14174.1 hypothetical protein Ycf21 [Aphanocladia delicatula]
MQFEVNTFHPICVVSLKQNNFITNKKSNSIKILTKIIVINEGSHTRLIQYLTNEEIKIKILQQNEKKNQKVHRRIRYVWLETSIYTKMTFARSLWTIKEKDLQINKIKRNLPIGQSFITTKIDINKYINEFHYFYCKDLEKELRSKKAIWGRKYKLKYEHNSCILIQEFFSPKIMFLFNKQLKI